MDDRIAAAHSRLSESKSASPFSRRRAIKAAANPKSLSTSLSDKAKLLPLIAAVFAPLATLLDIPGLSEHWFDRYGAPVADPGASRALSACSLAFSIVANALLVARFTVSESYWRSATTLSVAFWIIKTIIATVNLSVYGGFKNNAAGYAYTEAFWAAVASVIISGFLTILLVIHYVCRFDAPSNAGATIRLFGARFILTTMLFFSILAIQAVIFCYIEKWTYFESLYYSLVTAFTIGFGDFQPTTRATKVLAFPFAVASISLLAVMLQMLISFISYASSQRRAAWRSRYESHEASRVVGQEDQEDPAKRVTLVEELARLQNLHRKEERWDQTFALTSATITLTIFWVVGAAVFSALEDWSYGTAAYFTYVFFLTIGYGDYAPITGGGRVFFFVYALLAVPVVTNFVVTSVQGLLTSMADRKFQKIKDRRAPDESQLKPYHSHAANVHKSLKKLDERFSAGDDEELARKLDQDDKQEQKAFENASAASVSDKEKELTWILISLAIQLESQAREMLISKMDDGSVEQLLLRADKSLHDRAIKSLEKKVAKGTSNYAERAELAIWREEREERDDKEEEKPDILEQVRLYRKSYAAMLATGSKLLQLEGVDALYLERRLQHEHEDDMGGLYLGSGLEGPAEEQMHIDV